jgi:DNA-3-methyladenine glycosylase I
MNGVYRFMTTKLYLSFSFYMGAQAGLSWITVLKKRENYRKAFADFEVEKVARFNARSIERLMNDAGIIRNRLKINSAISNAKLFIEIQNKINPIMIFASL